MADEALAAAYRATAYLVHANPPLALRIGEASADLDRLLCAQGASSAAFLTAWNPRSQPRDDAVNRAALDRMEDDLNAAACSFLSGEGVADDGGWREPSLLVLGIARTDATALARDYGQNAYLFAHVGAVPELVGTDMPGTTDNR